MILAARDTLTGGIIDEYRIGAKLGEGGFGVVYDAHHVAIEKRCAIKVLHEHVAKNPTIALRIRQEAMAASRVKSEPGSSELHENVAKVDGLGQLPDGRTYIRYEFLNGHDLEAGLLDRGRQDGVPTSLPWDLWRVDVIAAIVIQVCRALAAAHTAGVVHCDIKPSNVFLTRSPRQPRYPMVKVLDFGIADVRRDLRLTGLATMRGMGTPLFMAPEQHAGDALDERADVWAVGCLLYYGLTGFLPFPPEIDDGQGGKRSVTDVMLYTLQRRGTVPPSQVRAGLDPRWDAIVGRCLAFDRADRYPNMGNLAHEIAAILGNGKDVLREVWPDFSLTAASPQDRTYKAGVIPSMGVAVPPAMTSRGAAAGSRDSTRPGTHARLWVAAAAVVVATIVAVAVVLLVKRAGERRDRAAATSVGEPARLRDAAGAQPATVADAAHANAPADELAAQPPIDAGAGAAPPSAEADAGPPKARPAVADPGTLTVVAVPFADVVIDGKRSTTPVTRRLAPGTYRIRIEPPHGKAEVVRVRIHSHRETRISRDYGNTP